jgi:hypothetical protein
MDGTAPTWWTLRELVGVVLAPQHLKRTGCVALIVGTVLFAMDQTRGYPRRPRDGRGLDQGRPDVSDAAVRLQFRAFVSHATPYCPRKITSSR